MQKYQTHVCLVSAQATPNITPALDPDFRPENVVLVVSDGMNAQATAIEDVIKPTGVKTERITIDDAWDIRCVEDALLEWLAKHEQDSVVLNVTGGTKPMAIAAQEVFRSAGLPVFYVHPEKDQVIFLYPSGERYDLGNRIKLKPYLKAHGFETLNPQHPDLPAKGRELTEYLLGLIKDKANLIGTLNFYAHWAEKTLVSTDVEKFHLEDADFVALIELLASANLLSLKQNRLHFTNEESRFFCNGGWLELYVFGVVNDLRERLSIQDMARSLEVVTSKGSKNEIDVAFLAENRLFLIECKTKKFSNQSGQQGASETLYKIDSLTSLGGVQTKGMLISFQKLSEWDRQRAKDLRIKTVVGPDIFRLKDEITTWVAPAKDK